LLFYNPTSIFRRLVVMAIDVKLQKLFIWFLKFVFLMLKLGIQ
jgi:hypothetical protein